MWCINHSYVTHSYTTHSYVRHDSFTRDARHLESRHPSYVTWLIHMWDMTRSYVRHDSFMRDTTTKPLSTNPLQRLIYGAMTHSLVPWLIYWCHDSFTGAMTHSLAPWLIHWCHDSFTDAMTDGCLYLEMKSFVSHVTCELSHGSSKMSHESSHDCAHAW